MTWPATDVGATNADAGTDVPANFRSDALDLINKFNQMRNHASVWAQGWLAAADAAAARALLGSEIVAGTQMLFAQTAAPTGWTKSTTHNNKALRVVSGTASSGGSVAFTTAFSSKTVSGTVGGTALTIAQMPAHTHTINYQSTAAGGAYGSSIGGASAGSATDSQGGGDTHTHSFSGTNIDLSVQYVDVIIAAKD